MVHRLKLIQPFYDEVKNRNKNFEIRNNDRDFKVGDTVVLSEWDKVNNCYAGPSLTRKIKYILKDCPEYGLAIGYCIFGW